MSGLKDLIEFLERIDPDAVVPHGFGIPMSYRGDYCDLAFEPVENARIGDMLDFARSALGAEFEGYKGGEYLMGDWTTCWIARYGDSGGDCIGQTMMNLWAYLATPSEEK